MRVAVVLGALCLLAAYSSLGQPAEKAAPSQEATKQQERGSDTNPLSVKIVPTPDASEKAAKDEEHRKQKAKEDRLLVFATIGLAVVTTALAIFTACLWWATRQLVIDAKETSKRQLRAYVSVKPDLPIKWPTFDKWHTDGVKFIVKNDGQTPAYNLRTLTMIGLKTPEQAAEPATFDDEGSRLTLTPGMHSEVRAILPGPLTENMRTTLRNGEKVIFIWGEIQYRDAFAADRHTRFRFRVRGGDGVGRLDFCDDGNEST